MEHKIDSSRAHDQITLLLLQPTRVLRSSVGTTNVTLWFETPHKGQFVFTLSPPLNCSLYRSSCLRTIYTHTVRSPWWETDCRVAGHRLASLYWIVGWGIMDARSKIEHLRSLPLCPFAYNGV